MLNDWMYVNSLSQWALYYGKQVNKIADSYNFLIRQNDDYQRFFVLYYAFSSV
jgi:hypothetical protein